MHSDINTSNNSSNTNNVGNYDMAKELNDSVSGSINDNTALDNNITYNNDNYTHNNLNSSNMRYLSLNNSKSEDDPPRPTIKRTFHKQEHIWFFISNSKDCHHELAKNTPEKRCGIQGKQSIT
ncbi:Hypothetical predicted protein [Octopus vulgaris]|uniref:Uncharacterized protein n=1 Tax=Octopus vulgaris TaxID=6645 RepID=A0AA36B3D4_OCTVU|nr:Hypothetical predicted protein [Octopus vulgaris]